MTSITLKPKSTSDLPNPTLLVWRLAQTLVWLIGLGIFTALLFFPKIGLLAFWNVLIPVAPALLVVATGVWRNICPLASTNLLARHFNLSLKKKMSASLQGKLQLLAVFALYFIVPLRHAVFNTNGFATAMLLLGAGLLSVVMGSIFDWKSGWCNSLCPLSPVEKLYGGNTLISIPNAHCHECANCTVPCPDSTPNFHPAISKKSAYTQISGLLTIGGLPGFIIAWFFVPDHSGPVSIAGVLNTYQMPALGFCLSLSLYLLINRFLTGKNSRVLINCFAATAVSAYYWFRIPALIGFGQFSGETVLFDLTEVLPIWGLFLICTGTTFFFFWWIVIRNPSLQSWAIRPKYAKPQPVLKVEGYARWRASGR